jgi:hypothetical protein
MKRYLPHLIAIVTFLVVTFAYLYPSLQGKVIFGGDTAGYVGMSKEANDFNQQNDQQTLWTGSMFGGMPTYQICMKEPASIVSYIDQCFQVLPGPTYRVFLYLIGFYILLITLGVSPYLSIAGAIAFAFGSYNLIIIVAGHNTKALAIAYMAPIIASIYVGFTKKPWWGAMLLALFLGLGLYVNHVQIIYYTLFTVICFGISQLVFAIKEKTLKPFFISMVWLIMGASLAVGLNATRLITTAEYAKATMRGESNGLTLTQSGTQQGLDFDYITNWSYGIDETLTLLIPNYMGGASAGTLDTESETAQAISKLTGMRSHQLAKTMETFRLPLYWGDQPFTAGPVYVGAIVCFLFVLGLFILPNKQRWWLLAATVLGILLSWGYHFEAFSRFFVNYVPMYAQFRTVSMTLTITCLCMCIMAFLAVKKWCSNTQENNLRHLYTAAGITAGICLLFALMPWLAGSFTAPSDSQFTGNYAFLQETLPADRAHLLSQDAWRSFAFIALAFVALWLYQKKYVKEGIFACLLAVLVTCDMLPIAHRYLNESHFVKAQDTQKSFKATTADNFILADKDPNFRVLNLTVDVFNSAQPSYFYKTIGGYSAVKLRRYQELIDVYLASEIEQFGMGLRGISTAAQADSLFANTPVINMLNTKYVVYHPDGMPLYNSHAMGNAWLINDIHWCQSANEEMLLLHQKDLHKTAGIDTCFKALFEQNVYNNHLGSITLTSYKPNQLEYRFSSSEPQVAVFSEIYYYTGWKAYINGQEVPHCRANYVLRAMPLPAGNYDIVFKFEPQSYQIGKILTIICSLLLTLAFGYIIFAKFKKQAQ